MTPIKHKSDCDVNTVTDPTDYDCSCGAVLSHRDEIITDCQAILARYLPPDGTDAKSAISELLEILDGPRGLAVIGKLGQQAA